MLLPALGTVDRCNFISCVHIVWAGKLTQKILWRLTFSSHDDKLAHLQPSQPQWRSTRLIAFFGLQTSASSESAVDFIVRMLNENPGEITILALAACTNIALALKEDPELHTKWKELVVLGGAFHINGNVNPAAEANILGDAEAADYVFAHGLNTYVVGLDVTMSCAMTREQIESMRGVTRFFTVQPTSATYRVRERRRMWNTMR